MTPIVRFALRLAASFVVAAPLATQAQTPFTTGSAEVRGFHPVSSTVVHAVAYGGGVYRSTNAGVNWTRIAVTNNARYLTGIAGNTNQIVVVGDEGVFRSADGGLTYSFQLAEGTAVVAMPSGASNVVLIGVKGLGIMRSTNGGVNFAAANNSAFDSLDPAAIAFHPNGTTVYAAMRPDGVGNRGGVFRSLDGGATWAAHTAIAGAGNNHVTDLVVDSGGTVYATVYRPSDGGGDTFIQANGTGAWAAGGFFGALSLHRDTTNGLTIWSGSRGLGLTRRVNGGGAFDYTFAATPDPHLFFTAVNAVTTLPGTTIAMKALKGAGVWRTTSYTPFNWTRVTGLSGADRVLSASNVGANASSMLMGLLAGGVWRTTDGGTNWAHPIVNGAVQADFAYFNGATGVNVFTSIWDIGASTSTQVAYVASGGKGMFYTNDNPGVFRFNGTRWQGVGNNTASSGPYSNLNEPGGLALPSAQVWSAAMHRSDDSRAYIGAFAGGGLYYRSGGTWTSPTNPAVVPAVRSFASATTNFEHFLALSFDDKPSYSTNGGATWTLSSMSQFGFERVRFFSVAELATAGVWIGGTNKGIMRSVDHGASWTRVNMAGVFQKQAITGVGLKSSNGRAFAADFAGNRYCSSNGGLTWVSAGGALRAGVNAIKTWGGNLYYLTDGAGMFREDGTC